MKQTKYFCDWCKKEVEFDHMWELTIAKPSEFRYPTETQDQICGSCYTALCLAVVPVERKRRGLE